MADEWQDLKKADLGTSQDEWQDLAAAKVGGAAPGGAAAPPSRKVSPGFMSQLGDVALGAVEAPLSLATGIPASLIGKVAAGGASAYAGLTGDPNWGKTAQKVREKVTGALTYQPTSESGKQSARAAGAIMSLPFKPIEWAGEKVEKAGYPNLGYLIKDVGETGLYALPGIRGIRETVTGKVLGNKTAKEAFQGLKQTVTEGYNKAIRPSVKGRGTTGRISKEAAKPVDAVASIIQNKDNIQFVDSAGNPLPPGQLPSGKTEALSQFGQAIEQTKNQLHDQFIEMREAAGNKPESLNPVLKFLDETLTKDKAWLDKNPALKTYIESEREAYANIGEWDLRSINKEITSLNQKTKSFFQNPVAGMHNHNVIDAGIAYTLRKVMDDAITREVGPGAQALRNKMGSLLAIEPEVAHRIVIDSRKNPKGIFEVTSPFILYELASNVARWNPAGMAAAGVAYLAKRSILRKNNPNLMIEKMFRKSEKHLKSIGDYGTALPGPLPPLSGGLPSRVSPPPGGAGPGGGGPSSSGLPGFLEEAAADPLQGLLNAKATREYRERYGLPSNLKTRDEMLNYRWKQAFQESFKR